MARAGTAIEQQGSSSQFRFEPGKGEIVAASVVVDQIEGYDAKTVLKVSVQRLDNQWKRTGDEPIEEMLGIGALTKFHPGNADNSEDEEPVDLGDEVGTEGNCIFSVEGGKIDRKSKAAIFSASLQEGGFKASLLNGYAPNLVGLQAEFDQLMLPKGADFKGKNDPTCLVLKKDGKVAKWPWESKGTKATGKAAAPATTGKPAAPTPITKGKANGVAVPEPASDAAGVDGAVEEKAVELLAKIAGQKAGQTVSRQKLGSALTVLVTTEKVPTAMHKPIQALVKNDEWFIPKAEEFSWGVTEAGEVVFPA